MFMVGALPALLVLFIRAKVEESPAFLARTTARQDSGLVRMLRDNAGRFLYVVLLMTAFNFFSHGTQDLYPTFLRLQHHFAPQTVGLIAIVYNIGAILGGMTFGALSERIGRRRGIVIAALGALLVIPLWAYGTSPVLLATGAFFMQFAVQGAWGIVPVHLNELSPHEVRGTFPGCAYQIGNLLASTNATLQASIADANGGNYAFALALVAALVAVVLACLTAFGSEARGIKFPAARKIRRMVRCGHGQRTNDRSCDGQGQSPRRRLPRLDTNRGDVAWHFGLGKKSLERRCRSSLRRSAGRRRSPLRACWRGPAHARVDKVEVTQAGAAALTEPGAGPGFRLVATL